MRSGDFNKAENLFERSGKLRSKDNLSRSSVRAHRAYVDATSGAIALAKGDFLAAQEKIVSASGQIQWPQGIQHIKIAVDVMCKFKRLRSALPNDPSDTLYYRCEALYYQCEAQLHVIDKQLLSLTDADIEKGLDWSSSIKQAVPLSKILLALAERFRKRLPPKIATSWDKQFRAVVFEADLSNIWRDFAVWLLQDPVIGVIKYVTDDADREAVLQLSALYRSGSTEISEWRVLADNLRKLARAAVHTKRRARHSANRSASYGDAYINSDASGRALSVAACLAESFAYNSADRAALAADVVAQPFARVSSHDLCDTKEAQRTQAQVAFTNMADKLLSLARNAHISGGKA